MIYIKKVQTTDPRFGNRSMEIHTVEGHTSIPVPDTIVLCDGCNKNIYPNPGYLVYLRKQELAKDQPYDFYCGDCVKEYFPKAKEV